MKKYKNIAFLLIALLIISSCKTEYKELTGSISGNVIAFDEHGDMLPDEITTVTIPDLNKVIQTNTAGFYIIKDIPVGTYKFTYKSPNTEENTKYGVQVTPGETVALLSDITLIQKSSVGISNLQIVNINYIFGFAEVSCVIEHQGTDFHSQKVVIFVSSDNNVSKENYDFFKEITTTVASFSTIIYFYSGGTKVDNIYFRAYTLPNAEYDFICDEYNMNCIDPGISDNPSNVLEIPINK